MQMIYSPVYSRLRYKTCDKTANLIPCDYIKPDYKSFALHPIKTKLAYMNRSRNTESNGGIFILIPCTEPTIQTFKVIGRRQPILWGPVEQEF